jgi:Ca2+-transporting ATPase
MLAVMYVEQLQPIFKTVPLGWKDWILVLIAAGIPTFLMGIGSVMQKPKTTKKITLSYSSRPVAR